jgi:hypothetical protein
VNHTPLEVPDAYIEKYPAAWREDRRWYLGLGRILVVDCRS